MPLLKVIGDENSLMEKEKGKIKKSIFGWDGKK